MNYGNFRPAHIWMLEDTPKRIYEPVRAVAESHAYGKIVRRSGVYVVRCDGWLLSCFENEVLVKTTYDASDALTWYRERTEGTR